MKKILILLLLILLIPNISFARRKGSKNYQCVTVKPAYYLWRKRRIRGSINGRRGFIQTSCRVRSPIRIYLYGGRYCVGQIKTYSFYGKSYYCQIRRIKSR